MDNSSADHRVLIIACCDKSTKLRVFLRSFASGALNSASKDQPQPAAGEFLRCIRMQQALRNLRPKKVRPDTVSTVSGRATENRDRH
jgi:hypothetical protein